MHVVGADGEVSGTAAALFTQLGPDGNVRLYGVENTSGATFRRPSAFGRVLCTDAAGVVAGCTTAKLDPVRATLAPPKPQPDTSALLSGSIILARTPVATAAAGRVRTAQLAIQRGSGRRCTWWSAPRKRFLRRSCRKPIFFAVRASGSRWKVRTGRLGAGTTTVWVRAVSGKRVQQVFRDRTNKRVVRVKRVTRGHRG